MKRLGNTGTDYLTWAHRLAGAGWLSVEIVVLALVAIPALGSGSVSWGLIGVCVRIASTLSVIMLVLAVAYSVFTVWGFTGSRLLFVKWPSYLVAVAASGYAIRAAREQDTVTTIVLAVVQLLAILIAIAIGVHLYRGRRAGRLPARSVSPDRDAEKD